MKTHKGWLRPYLFAIDELFWKRWEYWIRTIEADEILNEPIPRIDFKDPGEFREQKVRKNIQKCLNKASYQYSDIFPRFIGWLYWALGAQEAEKPDISKEIDDCWYRTFNLGLFFEEPADHLAYFASEYLGKSNSSGFFATPNSISKLIVEMTTGDTDRQELKHKNMLEPCCGTGSMVLHGSNYFLDITAVDINPLMVKCCTINCFIYVPWVIFRPHTFKGFNKAREKALLSSSPIVELELPSGMKIPRCKMCSDTGRSAHYFQKDYQAEVHLQEVGGNIQLDIASAADQLVGSGLKPKDLTCALCKRGVK